MSSLRSEPYLWIHLAGLATLPIWLDICLMGLAIGDPLLPPWLELGLMAGVGILPILVMQWFKPFYPFCLVVLALRPEQLTPERLRILNLYRRSLLRGASLLVALVLGGILGVLYYWSPIAAGAIPLGLHGRGWGLLVGAIAFLGANLFTQVPLSMALLLLTPEARVTATEPLAATEVRGRFTILGLGVKQLLPAIDPSLSPPQSR